MNPDSLSNPSAAQYTPQILPPSHPSGSLPFTGLDLFGFVAVAAILIVFGFVLRRAV